MPAAWDGRVWIGAGCAYFIGEAGDSSPHAHHLVQVVVGLAGDVSIEDANGDRCVAPGVVVPANAPHRIVGDRTGLDSDCLMIFAESFSSLGKRFSERRGESSACIAAVD